MKPFAIRFPPGTTLDFDDEGLARFQKYLFAQFHDAYDKLSSETPVNLFANLFVEFEMKKGKSRSIWVEYIWNRQDPALIHCIGYTEFPNGEIPDKVLDRINFLKMDLTDVKLRYMVWKENKGK